MKTQKKIVYIRRKMKYSDYLKDFIFSNINYRRKIWNLFVEKYYECNEDWDLFDTNTIASELINSTDKERRETEEYFASDIVKAVQGDVHNAIERIKKRTIEEHRHFSLNYKRFDRYKGSFKVRTGSAFRKSGNFAGKVKFKDEYIFGFMAHMHNKFNITLEEPICDYKMGNTFCYLDEHENLKCYFYAEDIKQIVFKHELGQFYISLCIDMTYIIKNKDIKKRNKLAGIDLGIHNPITLFDGNDVGIFDMGQKRLNKIHYLERRCRRLQNIMDRKYEINKKRHEHDPDYKTYTRNYEKVRRKFRRTWKRIRDIRCDWRRKMCKKISTSYKHIVVDTFKQPCNDKINELPNKVKRYINHYNREHAMSYFIETLKHDCKKYGCNFMEAPKYTTRTCSKCGHINPKLPLTQRMFKCEECGMKTDRDVNAAMNCYDSYQNH